MHTALSLPQLTSAYAPCILTGMRPQLPTKMTSKTGRLSFQSLASNLSFYDVHFCFRIAGTCTTCSSTSGTTRGSTSRRCAPARHAASRLPIPADCTWPISNFGICHLAACCPIVVGVVETACGQSIVLLHCRTGTSTRTSCGSSRWTSEKAAAAHGSLPFTMAGQRSMRERFCRADKHTLRRSKVQHNCIRIRFALRHHCCSARIVPLLMHCYSLERAWLCASLLHTNLLCVAAPCCWLT